MLLRNKKNVRQVYWINKVYPTKPYYRKALATAERIGDLTGQATYGMNVANVLNETGRVNEALPYYDRALELCRAQGYADQHMSLLGGYIAALKRTGDLAGALRLQSELTALKDTVYKEDRMRAVSDMQVKYETERTEKELLAAQARADEQRAVIERQRLRMVLLGVGVAILAVITMLVLRLQRARHRQQLDRQLTAEANDSRNRAAAKRLCCHIPRGRPLRFTA